MRERSKAAGFLYNNGIFFYEQGVLDRNGVAIFDFYRIDKISAEQKLAVLTWCKDARFFDATSSRWPLGRCHMIAFPKAGFYRVGFKN